MVLCGILLLAGTSFANPVSEYIGPNGGAIKLGDGSRLIVPEGALGDAEAALSYLRSARTRMFEEALYIFLLGTQDGNSDDEWIAAGEKRNVLKKIGQVINNINKAIVKTEDERYENATNKVSVAIDKLNELDKYVKDLLRDKISQSAADNIIDCNNLAREELEVTISKPDFLLGTEITVESFHCIVEVEGEEYTVLVYECNPTGLVFNGSSPIEVPFALLEGNIQEPIVVLYSQDGEEIDEAYIDYDIDWDAEIITFYIPHFTYYYFPP
jgi:hypothetical protein